MAIFLDYQIYKSLKKKKKNSKTKFGHLHAFHLNTC